MNKTGEMLRERSFAFAVQIVKLTDALQGEQHDYVISRQLLKSGTSIGANIREARFAQSDADFISKLSIALKEADETAYWLELLQASGKLTEAQCNPLSAELDTLIGILVNVVKSMKQKAQNPTHKARSATKQHQGPQARLNP